MSDSDDSDDSGLPFDVEIEKCEKRLQLARYKKKYRNEWDYITNRWQEKHIHIVLKDIEQKWRVYSAGSHEQIHFQNISEAFRYLEDVYAFHEHLDVHAFIFNNFSSSRSVRQLKLKFMSNRHMHTIEDTYIIEAPDIYTIECMKIAYGGICRDYYLPQDIWSKHILPLLFRQQTLDNFNERCKVARELKEAERVLRNFRLGYADHYAEERRQHKFLYDVYTNFIRGLHSKHDKLEEKVKRRLAQMDELLEKFKAV